MTGKDLFNLVFMNFIPTFAGPDIFSVHKGWMQISRKGKSFIEDQCDAVVAVTGCVDDLSVESDVRKKFSAVFQFQDEIIVLFVFTTLR